MHNYSIKGLIDRDYMTEAEISCYKESNIYTLDVAEVENLYLIEDIIKLVAENQALEPNETFNQVKQFYSTSLKENMIYNYVQFVLEKSAINFNVTQNLVKIQWKL